MDEMEISKLKHGGKSGLTHTVDACSKGVAKISLWTRQRDGAEILRT